MKQHIQVFRAGLVVPVVLRPRQPSSISRRALLCSLSCPRMHATLCPGGANTYLPPNCLLPHFSPPSFTFRLLPKCLISSSAECGPFREKSEGIINQGSHRRRHVTLGRGPGCHQPVQTKHSGSKCMCTLMCVFREAASINLKSHWLQGQDFLSL